ncbi:MAG: FAD-binding oxidoreductase [Pseudomonadota bacterium]
MTATDKTTVVIGAGIVGVSTAIWLRRAGVDVTLIDRAAPGRGTSYGNAGVLANCSMVPVTTPGLILKGPRLALDPNFPLFVRWSYLPKLMPWLIKYLSHANDRDTRRIAQGLTPIVSDAVDQHHALVDGTRAEKWVVDSDYVFAYPDRAAFEAEDYVWRLRSGAGFDPVLIEGDSVRDYDSNLGPEIGCLAVMKDHGYVRDPGGYVLALAEEFQSLGGTILEAEVTGFEFSDGKVVGITTTQGLTQCAAAVLATGVWSKSLMRQLGLSVPLETERGYHVVFEGAEGGPSVPIMVAAGKFVATPMAEGVRCAGIVEFGGLDAGPSKAPFELLRREVRKAFPRLTAANEIEWQGHRPAPADSLPLIGEIDGTGIYAGFGHHHIGLTAGPKTGRLLAQMITGRRPNIDMTPYAASRFAA